MYRIITASLVIILGAALAVPIFADEVKDTLNNTTSSFNNTGNNSSSSDNSTENNSTLTLEQLQKLNETQDKLLALIAIIQGIKTSNNSTIGSLGLFTTLSQFEKQANTLNEKINLFIQNPSINGANGRINSFIKREEALEHKVTVKQEVISKKNNKTGNLQKAPQSSSNGQNKNK